MIWPKEKTGARTLPVLEHGFAVPTGNWSAFDRNRTADERKREQAALRRAKIARIAGRMA